VSGDNWTTGAISRTKLQLNLFVDIIINSLLLLLLDTDLR